MSIQRTHSLINELNELLQRKFPGLTMELGAFSQMSVRENVSFYEKNTTPPRSFALFEYNQKRKNSLYFEHFV